MASRHVSKAVVRAASVVVEALERRQLLTYSTLELYSPPANDSQTATALPDVRVDTPEPMARATVAGGVRLAWPAVNGARNGYEIHRRIGDGNYEMIATVRGNAAMGRLGGRVSYLDLNLQPGEYYTYRIRGVGAASTRGQWSETVSVVVDKKALDPQVGRTQAMVAASVRLAAYATSGSSSQLSWSHLPDAANGYQIQRRFGDDAYATIATLTNEQAVVDVNGQISFADSGLLEGEGYTYRVRPLGVTGNEAAWSNEYSVLIPRVSQTTDNFVLAGEGSTLTLNTIADTHARSGSSAAYNFGSDAWNGAKSGTGDEDRIAFYKFDLSSVAGGTASVKLRLNGRLSASDGTRTFLIKAVEESWTETTLTYGSKPSLGATLGSFNVSSTTDGWYEVDITNYVAAKIAAGTSIVSFAVAGSASSTAYFRINSKESGPNSAQLAVTLDAATSVRTPTADTHVRAGTYASNNYGNDAGNNTKASATTDEKREGYYRFELGGAMAGTVTQAKIRFNGRLNTSDGTRTFNLYSVSNTSWTETGLTWNNKPAAESGGALGSFTVSSTSDGWYEVDVTSYIQGKLGNSSQVSFVLQGAANSTAYFITNSKESGIASAQLVMTFANQNAPSAPTNLQATQTTPPVTLTWTDNSSDETGFVIQRRVANGTWANIAAVGANVTTYPDASVLGSTAYEYQVRSVRGTGVSAWSSSATITTGASTSTTMEPVADTYVSGAAQSTNYGTQNDLWVRNATDGSTSKFGYMKFDIHTLTGAVASARLRLWTTRSNLSDSNLQFAIAAVSDNGWSETGMIYTNRPTIGGTLATVDMTNDTQFHWYEVDLTSHVKTMVENSNQYFSIAALGVTSTSAEWQIKSRETTTGYDPQLTIVTVDVAHAPQAPTNFHTTGVVASGATTASVSLAWTDNSPDETGFRLWRRPAGGAWLPLDTLPANETSYSDTTAATDSTYDYQIAATNSAGDSSYVILTGVVTPPTAASGLQISGVTYSGVSLSWADNSSTETEYRIERRITGTPTYSTIKAELAANTTSWVDDTAIPGTRYDYRVRAIRGTLDGSASAPVQMPEVPTGVTATVVGASAINVTWTDNASTETGYDVVYSTSSTFASGVSVATASANATSKLITGLTAGTTYYFLVRTKATGTQSISGPAASATTLGALRIDRSPPSGNVNEGSPILLTAAFATGVVPGTMMYTWTINGQVQAPSSSSTFPLTPADQGTITASVVAKNGLAEDSAQLAPTTVVNVAPTLTAAGNSSIIVGQAYTLTLAATDPGLNDVITWTIDWDDGQTQTPSPTGRSLSLTHQYQTPGNYTISISANDGVLPNVTANPATIQVTVNDVAPTAPTSLHRIVPAHPLPDVPPIAIAWQDNSSNETGFVIDRKVGTGAWITQPSKNLADDGDYTDSSYDASSDTAYRVRAVNSAGPSANSNELIIPARPVAPTAGPVSANSVTLTWADVSNMETGYHVESLNSSGEWVRLTTTPLQAVAGSVTYVDPTVSPSNTYTYRVRAISASAEGLPSDATTVTPRETLRATIIDLPAEPPSEGDTVHLSSLVSNADPEHGLTYAWSVTSDVPGFQLPTETVVDQPTLSFVAPDNGSYEITLTVTDTVTEDSDNATVVLDVENAAPAIELIGDSTARTGAAYSLDIVVSDVGPDTVTQMLVDWGDNSDPDHDGDVGEIVTDLGSPATHTYATAGTYTIHAAVTDEDGTYFAPTHSVEVGAAPTAPTSPSVSAGSAVSMSLTWVASAGVVEGYRIERRVGDGEWEEVGLSYGSATSYLDGSFVLSSTLQYRIYAFNRFGSSPASSVASFTTGDGDLSAPSSVTATATSPNSIHVTWQNQSSSVVDFLVEASANGGEYVPVGAVAASGASFNATGLDDGTSYTFRVIASAEFGSSAPALSNSVVTPMFAPSSLTAAIVGNSASLGWSDLSANEGRFEIQYRKEGGQWQDASDATAGATTAPVSNLEYDAKYEFRVRAASDEVESDWSYASAATAFGKPVITITGDMLEGEPVQLSVSFENPAPPQEPTFSWNLNGDGDLTAADAATATFIPDDDGYFVATLSITYASGMTQTISKEFHIDDVAPVASISGDNSVTLGQTYTLELNYDDVDADPATSWVIDWGDGTSVQSITGSPHEASHTYASPGSYTISARVVSDGEPCVIVPWTVSVEGEGSGAAVTIAQRLEASQSPVPATLSLHSVSTTWLKLNCSVTDGSRPQLEMRGPNDANYHDISVSAATILAEEPVNLVDLVPNTLYRFRLRTDTNGSVAYSDELEIRTEQLSSTGDTIIDLPVPQDVRVVGPVLYFGADVLYTQYQPPLDANDEPIGYVHNAELMLTSNDPLGIIQAWIQSQVQQDQTDVWLNDPLDGDSLLNFKIDPSPYTYKAKVRAIGELNGVNGASEWSEWTNEFQYFPQYTPPAPQLSTELNADGSTTISWPYDAGFDTDFGNEGDVTQIKFYVLDESAPASSQLLTGAWSRDGSVTVDVPDGTKIVAVAQKDSSGWGEYSRVITIGTPEIPSVPRDLEGFYSESVGVRLVWTNRPNNEDRYEIERSSNGVSFTKIGEAGADVTTFVHINAQLDARSWYRVRAVNSDGNSGYSNLVLVAPQSEATLDLDVDSNNDGKIDVNNTVGFGTDDPVEADTSKPGNLLAIDDGDTDGDAIPGFADGIDKVPNDNHGHSSPLQLQELILTPPIGYSQEDLDDAQVVFDYKASSPEAVTVAGEGTTESPYVFGFNAADEENNLRIWAIDATLLAPGQAFPSTLQSSDLMFIGAGEDEQHTWEELAGKRFFIQAVKPTTDEAQRTISVTMTVDPEGEAVPYSDTVRVTATRFDLDVMTGSATADGLILDRSDRTEKDEDDVLKPGQVLVVNDADRDVDGIPDLADGFDATSSEDDATSASTRFSPLLIEIPADADLSMAALSLEYSASDPANLRSVGTTFSPAYAPAEGTLRIWLKDGNASRSKLNALTGQGDYVGAGEYSGAALSRLPITVDENGRRYIKLWVEAVRASSGLGAETVTVGLRLNKANPLSLTLTDSARFTVIQSKVSDAQEGLVSTADGSFRYESWDFDLAGWTENFGQGLLFTDAPEYILSTGNDAATSVTEWPRLVNAGSSMMVLIGGKSYFFDFIPENPNTPWKARFAGHQKLVQTEGGDLKFVTDRGETWIFKGFGESLKAVERGQFKKYVSVGGQAVTVTAFDGEGRIQTITRGTATLEYTYVESGDSKGELKSVTAKRGTDTLHRVTYEYYTKDAQFGGAHDIMSASIEMGTTVVEKKRFFYTKSQNPDQRSVLQSVIEGRNYARAVHAGLDPAAEGRTPAQLSTYASFVLNAGAVYTPETGTISTNGGSNPVNGVGVNAWSTWQVSTVGNLVTTVFSNSSGQPMVIAERDTATKETHFEHFRYNTKGLLEQESSRLAVATYDQSKPDLVDYTSATNAKHLRDTAGQITSYTYDSHDLVASTTIRNGELGSGTLLSEITYDAVGTDGIYQPATKTLYVGTGENAEVRTTTYAYDDEAHNLPQLITTTRPDELSEIKTYNDFGRLTSVTDADEYVHETQWDNELGIALVQWIDKGEGQLNLATTRLESDRWGRPIRVQDPLNRVTSYIYIDDFDRRTVKTTLPNHRTIVTTDRQDLGFTQTRMLFVPEDTSPISASRQYYDVGGRTLRRDDYFAIPTVSDESETWGQQSSFSDDGKHFNRTTFAYDSIGRLTNVIDPTGVNRETVLDAFGRVVQKKVQEQTTHTYRYVDDPNTGTSYTITTAIPGVGSNRTSTDYFDWRGRKVATENGIQLVWRSYNNVDEPVREEIFDNASNRVNGVISGVPVRAAANVGRVAQTTREYDDMGMVRRVERHAVAAEGSVSAGLVALTTYDGRGNVIAQTEPGGLFTETSYDGAGRAYYSWTGSEDTPLEATATTYDDAGNAILVKSFAYSGSYTRVQSIGNWYDKVDRLVTSVNYGTSDVESRPETPQPRVVANGDDEYLRSDIEYGSTSQTSTDPRGIRTYTGFDALGRVKTEYRNWSSVSSDETNRRTQYVYDAKGRQVQIAELSPNRTTERLTTKTYGSPFTDQPTSVRLPAVEGAPPQSFTDGYVFNALGEVVSHNDRNGPSTRAFEYDAAGRMVRERTVMPTGEAGKAMDNRANARRYVYDVLNRPVRQMTAREIFNPSTGKVITWVPTTEIRRQYDAFGNVLAEYQELNGAISANTPAVRYEYELANNGVRSKRMIFPTTDAEFSGGGGRSLWYGYTGLGAEINRVSYVADSSAGGNDILESYQYLGVNQVVGKSRPLADGSSGSLATSQDSTTDFGLDRFGRVDQQTWKSGSTTVYNVRHWYDANSNLLAEQDLVRPGLSELYQGSGAGADFAYDPFNQKKVWGRGELQSANGVSRPNAFLSTSSASQTWGTTATGQSRRNMPPDDEKDRPTFQGDFDADLMEDKMEAYSDGNNERKPNGSLALKFDVFGNLTRVEDWAMHWGANNYAQLQWRKSFVSDALGRRLGESSSLAIVDGQPSSSESANYYYDLAGKVIEERKFTPQGSSKTQYVWGAGDGQLVLRDRDVDGNAGTGAQHVPNGIDQRIYAITDLEGNIAVITSNVGAGIERYAYSPEGKLTIFNPEATAVRADSSYAWNMTYRSGRRDAEGMYYTRSGEWDYLTGATLQPDSLSYWNAALSYNAPTLHWADKANIAITGTLLVAAVTVATAGVGTMALSGLGIGVAAGGALTTGGSIAVGTFAGGFAGAAQGFIDSYGAGDQMSEVWRKAAIGGAAGAAGGALGGGAGVLARGFVNRVGLNCANGMGRVGGFIIGAAEGGIGAGAEGFVRGTYEGGLSYGMQEGLMGFATGGAVGGVLGSLLHQVCFVAGTQVVVAIDADDATISSAPASPSASATGTKLRYKTIAIEDLVARGGGEMGDGRTSTGAAQVVLSRDQHDPDGPLVRARVSRTYQRTAYALRVLTVRDEDGALQTLRVTEEHPFFVRFGGWTPAKSLEAGDTLLGAEGTLTVVANEHEAHPHGVTVYNLEIEQAHTYFVLAAGANDVAAVWVHNATASYARGVRGSNQTVDAVAMEIESAATRAEALLRSGGTGGTRWGRIYQRYAGTGTWRERVALGNAIQQVADSHLVNNTVMQSAGVVFNRARPIGLRNLAGNLLRPDYQLPLTGGRYAIFDIGRQAGHANKYSSALSSYLVDITY